jgi:hypothetical protein
MIKTAAALLLLVAATSAANLGMEIIKIKSWISGETRIKLFFI